MTPMEEYRRKLRTAEEIAAAIPDGSILLSDAALAQPIGLIEAIAAHAASAGYHDLTQHILLDSYPMPFYDGDSTPEYHAVSWFSSAGARRAVNAGRADVMPCHYRDMPRLIRAQERIDAFCAAVSPMDSRGYFSFSTVGSFTRAALEKAEHIYLEVNDQMPRVNNASVIHISQVDGVCEISRPLAQSRPPVIDEVSRTIGGLIAQEIPDGATIQLGIGAVPEAVGLFLKEKHHLGIHTELFSDALVELLECGAADNSRKPIHPGRSVMTFAFGTQRVYDYIDGNPAVEILGVDYVNNPAVIAQHPNFISVNGAIEVDFFGQVCAESVGSRHISGSGGQADYVRGAIESEGGKSFIAFPSTANGGQMSRIRPILTPGAVVTTSKNDVDYIVTEYGVAKLRGRTLSQRTKALISIAHPKFREELTYQAREAHILI